MPKREFIYVDDLADACATVLKRYPAALPLNIGTDKDVAIAEFARLIAEVVSYGGKLVFDAARPDDTPRKLLDVLKLKALGWSRALRLGLERTYADFLAEQVGAHVTRLLPAAIVNASAFRHLTVNPSCGSCTRSEGFSRKVARLPRPGMALAGAS